MISVVGDKSIWNKTQIYPSFPLDLSVALCCVCISGLMFLTIPRPRALGDLWIMKGNSLSLCCSEGRCFIIFLRAFGKL